jgi:hypothetical protein
MTFSGWAIATICWVSSVICWVSIIGRTSGGFCFVSILAFFGLERKGGKIERLMRSLLAAGMTTQEIGQTIAARVG